MKRVFSCLLLFSAFAFGLAQDPPVMSPPEEITKLNWWLGEWTGKVKWTMPNMPEMETAMSFKNEMEGNFIKGTSKMDMEGMSMTEVSYTGWDPKNKRYTSYAFTNMSAMPRIEHGNIEGDKFIAISEPWDAPGMEGLIGRATVTKKSDRELHFLLEFKQGESWTKVGEGTFTKK